MNLKIFTSLMFEQRCIRLNIGLNVAHFFNKNEDARRQFLCSQLKYFITLIQGYPSTCSFCGYRNVT